MRYGKKKNSIGNPSLVERLKDRIRYKDRYHALKNIPEASKEQKELINTLKRDGYIVLNNYVDAHKLEKIKNEFDAALKKLKFNTPCLAQKKINPITHVSLIKKHMLATSDELSELQVTFNSKDCTSYEQVLADFEPSTLTVKMLEQSDSYCDIWLDPYLLSIICNYMGMVPQLTEAYVRRNFPAKHKTMNHFWHRDMNHHSHLLKMFVFLTNCSEDTGPHEYIRGSCTEKDKINILNNKRYYQDNELDKIYPLNSKDRILSTVPAGTIIIEDTRGLHRANIPKYGYRDLGYAIFTPGISKNISTYGFNASKYSQLSNIQKLLIPKQCILK